MDLKLAAIPLRERSEGRLIAASHGGKGGTDDHNNSVASRVWGQAIKR